MTALDRVAAAIARHRFRFDRERDLQDGIALALEGASIGFRREVHLTTREALASGLRAAGCIDFLVDGGVGLEVKIGGTLAAVTRQLHRYAHASGVDSLLLVTAKKALDRLPDALVGKPLRVVHLLGSAL